MPLNVFRQPLLSASLPPEQRQAEGAAGPRQQHWGGLGLSVLNGAAGTGPWPGEAGGLQGPQPVPAHGGRMTDRHLAW